MKDYKLIVDIGNTTTIFGVFDDKELVNVLITYTNKNSAGEKEKMLNKFVFENDYKFTSGMIFSVVPSESEKIQKLIKKVAKLDVKIFNPRSYKNFKTTVETPNEIGADLIADLVAARELYGTPALIVDLGTVNKILYINKNKEFEGCSFLPGFSASLASFNEKAALLPDVKDFKKPSNKLGRNTEDAMIHGVFWSTVSFIKKEIETFPKGTKLILTGGHCKLVESEIDNKVVDQFLTLKGMNIIFAEMEKWTLKN